MNRIYMRLIWKSIKRILPAWLISSVVYTLVLFFSVYSSNHTSLIMYPIQPYIYGSEPVDLFFPLFTTLPFVWPVFFLRINNFLEYVSLRIKPGRYIAYQASASLILCFFMVFLVNITGVLFSLLIANTVNNVQGPSLAGYILGEMQMMNPVHFGLLWSFYKAIIGLLICTLGLILAYYVKNMFLMFLAPFTVIFLENFLTAITGLARYSFTTTFVLNRLDSSVMLPKNLLIGIYMFIILTFAVQRILARYEHQNN